MYEFIPENGRNIAQSLMWSLEVIIEAVNRVGAEFTCARKGMGINQPGGAKLHPYAILIKLRIFQGWLYECIRTLRGKVPTTMTKLRTIYSFSRMISLKNLTGGEP